MDEFKIIKQSGKFKVSVANIEMFFDEFIPATKWAEAVILGIQPDECIFGGGCCGYPIEECNECPVHPGNYDPYMGMTKVVIR